MRPTIATVVIVFLVVLTGVGVGAAARSHVLIPAAAPFAVALLLTLRALGRTPELLGWAVFTGWLGLTYAQAGSPVEVVMFFVYVTLGALGVFKSPWFLAAAWAVHPAWDLLPRTLPDQLRDLPMACLIFDALVAAYLAWGARRGRWPFAAQDQQMQR